VRIVESGREGIDLLRHERIDVAICELDLPDMPGTSWLDQAHVVRPGVQVIMMSAGPSFDVAAEAMRRDAIDYLSKPIVPNAALRSVGNAAELKRIDGERRDLLLVLARKSAEVEDLANMRAALLQLLRHDLANVISGAAAALLRKKNTIEEYRDADELVLRMLQQAENVIEEIREHQSGKGDQDLGPCEPALLKQLVDMSLATFQTMAASKHIEVRVSIPANLVVLVRPSRFVLHVLNNLISNAIKFSFPDSHVDIEGRPDGDWAVMTVRDHGCGVPEAQQPFLFKSGKSTTGTMGELGTGYGLCHAKEALASIGGNIEMVSTCSSQGADHSARGTCFTVRVRQHVHVSTLEPEADASDTVDLEPVTPGTGLLIIDDAWPVTDALCLALLDLLPSYTDGIHLVDYLRVPPSPRLFPGDSGMERVRFRPLLDLTGGDREAAMNDAFGDVAPGTHRVVLLQDKQSIQLFHARLADPRFRRRLLRNFGLLAVDYALGLPVTGTDILRIIGPGPERVLISANAEEHLPGDYRECCESRIQKSGLRLPTLAQRLVDANLG
jgi:signal transduction histidine kinase